MKIHKVKYNEALSLSDLGQSDLVFKEQGNGSWIIHKTRRPYEIEKEFNVTQSDLISEKMVDAISEFMQAKEEKDEFQRIADQQFWVDMGFEFNEFGMGMDLGK